MSTAWNSSRANENPRTRLIKTLLLPILHLVCCIAVSFCMVYGLQGYNAVAANSSRTVGGGHFKLRVSDVTTIISTALTVVKLLVGAWTGVVIWNCVFILLENKGLTLHQINRIVSFYLPPLRKQGTVYFVMLLLLLVIPQQLINPLLSGAVDWQPSFEYSPVLAHVQSGNPQASATAWYWYSFGRDSGYVRRAAGLASLAWDGTTPDQGHCRHNMNLNPDSIPINSTLLNATIPCIQIHSITFPNAPPPASLSSLIFNSLNQNTTLSRIGEGPFLYYSGSGVLFDPDHLPSKQPFPPIHNNQLTTDYPTDFIQRSPMTAVVLLGSPDVDGHGCTAYNQSIFGPTISSNVFTPITSGLYYRCFAYAIVNFTAGIVTSPRSTYITNRIVEADLPVSELEIRAGPWVQEAMNLMPDVMGMLSIMNSTSLNTWKDLEGYMDKLIRYSYQAAWDSLYRGFDPNITDLAVMVYEPRLQASVSRVRVFSWLGISLLLSLSGFVLVLGKPGGRERILDGAAAALMTDPSGVQGTRRRELTNLSYLTKEDTEWGNLTLQRQEGVGGYHLVSSSTLL